MKEPQLFSPFEAPHTKPISLLRFRCDAVPSKRSRRRHREAEALRMQGSSKEAVALKERQLSMFDPLLAEPLVKRHREALSMLGCSKEAVALRMLGCSKERQL